jgi:lipopolysaccharide/colanic/teichoic acid biosynthesis glycosyltransferase
MLLTIIYIATFLIALIGLILIAAMLSNKMFVKIMNDVNSLADNFNQHDLNKYSHVKYYDIFKRLFDILFSIIFIILLSPIIVLISIAIILDSNGPIIYRMKIIGRNGKMFYSYKFRTMKVFQKITYENAVRDDSDSRITKFGLFLRKTLLDELPELFNVLKGNMSIVGTSLAREYEYENISDAQKKILTSRKPGLTNLWIVSRDRNIYNYERKLLYDLYYLNNYSFKLDLSIIYRTIIFTLGETASF